MSQTKPLTVRSAFSGLLSLLEHGAAIFLGFVLMVVGLALGVTMIMLPVGIVVGLLGVAIVISGVFYRTSKA